MFFGRANPYAVVFGVPGLVAQDEHNPFADVNGEAPEHWTGTRIEFRQGLKDEGMGGRLAGLRLKEVVDGEDRLRLTASFGHRLLPHEQEDSARERENSDERAERHPTPERGRRHAVVYGHSVEMVEGMDEVQANQDDANATDDFENVQRHLPRGIAPEF
jgi:hypothetical protein